MLRESSIDSRFEALRAGGGASLFGREDELALLLHRWREAQRGEGRVVLLSGEAGIGKSRLAAALENRLLSEPHTRRRYLCSPHHQDTLLHPVIAQLTRAAGFEREDDAAAKLRKLAALVPTGASAEEFALIADLLSLPAPAEANLAELTPQQRKERTFAAILRQLERLTDENPVLAIIEDLHWADPPRWNCCPASWSRSRICDCCWWSHRGRTCSPTGSITRWYPCNPSVGSIGARPMR